MSLSYSYSFHLRHTSSQPISHSIFNSISQINVYSDITSNKHKRHSYSRSVPTSISLSSYNSLTSYDYCSYSQKWTDSQSVYLSYSYIYSSSSLTPTLRPTLPYPSPTLNPTLPFPYPTLNPTLHFPSPTLRPTTDNSSTSPTSMLPPAQIKEKTAYMTQIMSNIKLSDWSANETLIFERAVEMEVKNIVMEPKVGVQRVYVPLTVGLMVLSELLYVQYAIQYRVGANNISVFDYMLSITQGGNLTRTMRALAGPRSKLYNVSCQYLLHTFSDNTGAPTKIPADQIYENGPTPQYVYLILIIICSLIGVYIGRIGYLHLKRITRNTQPAETTSLNRIIPSGGEP